MDHPRRQEGRALTAGDFAAAATADERRREPRIASNRVIAILPCASATQKTWRFSAARLLDCSAKGLGLVTSLPFESGDQFLVKLQLQRIVLVQYTVRQD